MPSEWMPGAERRRRRDDGGAMIGGPPRAVWHTTESGTDPDQFKNMRYPSHLVWQPRTGEIVQLIPATRAGRALENDDGWPQTNRMGRVNIQIEVVGEAAHPFTNTEMRGLDPILAWLDSWGIPREFPAGRPGGNEMYGPNPQRSARTWTRKAGHYGHSQVPENAHWDPGRIDITKLLGGDDVSAKDVWTWDRIRVPWKRKGDKNWQWQTQHALASIWDNSWKAHREARQMRAEVRAELAAIREGCDPEETARRVDAAVKAALEDFEAELADAEVVLRTGEENPS